VPKPVQMNLKLDGELREKIQAAADARGYSATKEINDRLQHSFAAGTDDRVAADKSAKALSDLIAWVIWMVGNSAGFTVTGTAEGGKSWAENPYVYDQVCKAVAHVMDCCRPEGSPKIEDLSARMPEIKRHLDHLIANTKMDFFENAGVNFAQGTLADIRELDVTAIPPGQERKFGSALANIYWLKARLGSFAERLNRSKGSQS
jgi:hypothetical protein